MSRRHEHPMPRVSVLLPVHNAGKFLRPALESILGQTYRDFELLLLDDGSTDGSGELAQQLAERDARLVVTRREQRGLVASLNELIAMARGDLLARMDADDIASNSRLARQVEFMDRHPGVVCVGGAQLLIDEAGRPIAPIRPLLTDAQIQDHALRGHGSVCHPTAMIRSGAMKSVGGYRGEYYPAEDLDLWLRLGEIGALANLEDVVLLYRIHTQSISGQDSGGRQREAGARACADAWRRRGLGGLSYEAEAPWRPTAEPESRMKFALQWGWMAYNSGFTASAIAFGSQAIRIFPGRAGGWRLLFSALFKPRPGDVRA